MTKDARVLLWGTEIGAITWVDEREIGVFQYAPDFLKSGIQVSPLMMPLREFTYEFPELGRDAFKGLPGLLADSLPDKFGNAVIDAWLASQGRTPESFHPVERLCYTGNRGMGALEFKPTVVGVSSKAAELKVSHLVELSNMILEKRSEMVGVFTGDDDRVMIEDILRVGTSAGGARAKAILAWNPNTNEFRSGQLDSDSGFEHWLMKFDGVSNNKDKESADPKGFGEIEYAYHLMAKAAGIHMAPCRLHKEGGRSHFMTQRFDRTETGAKLHMQTLGAMAHFDYNQPASYSYEQAIQVMKQIGLPREDLEQQVLRAMFNVVARNQDDHVKNIAFLMDRRGAWRLSPAYDVTYAWEPTGAWTNRHQMSLNQKRDDFVWEDFVQLSGVAGIKKAKATRMLDHVLETVKKWEQFAEIAGISNRRIVQISRSFRTCFI